MDEFPVKQLLLHKDRYPCMGLSDAVKLLYQNEFGNGHLITDEALAFEMLLNERQSIKKKFKGPLFEDIGNKRRRLNLAAINTENISLYRVYKIFYASAKRGGDILSFNNKLNALIELSKTGVFNFTDVDLTLYLTMYDVSDGPPRHSVQYNREYTPAYRVVDAAFEKLWYVILIIERLLEQGPVIIGIEGCSASGKTTAAELLKEIYDAALISMDDFFMPLHTRDTNDWQKPGGNIDYARFNGEVAESIAQNRPIRHKKYCCQTGEFIDMPEQEPNNLTIVEGAYCTHPNVNIDYSLKIFFDIDSDEQKKRVANRDKDLAEDYFNIWIPRESAYFKEFNVRDNCSIIVNNFGIEP